MSAISCNLKEILPRKDIILQIRSPGLTHAAQWGQFTIMHFQIWCANDKKIKIISPWLLQVNLCVAWHGYGVYIHLSSEAQCVSHHLPKVDCHNPTWQNWGKLQVKPEFSMNNWGKLQVKLEFCQVGCILI